MSSTVGAASYDGRIRLPIRGADADLRELERVITHEFTHALIQHVAPRGVPIWLQEGLAVMFEPDGAAWSQGQLAEEQARLPLPPPGPVQRPIVCRRLRTAVLSDLRRLHHKP